MDYSMLPPEQAAAFTELEKYVTNLSEKADKSPEETRKLWERIVRSEGVLRELAYFHDTGNIWDGYEIAGFHLADIIVWQVDHFKAYMDREDMNRYHTERLFLEALETMLQMEVDPEPIVRKMREESGTDSDQKTVK